MVKDTFSISLTTKRYVLHSVMWLCPCCHLSAQLQLSPEESSRFLSQLQQIDVKLVNDIFQSSINEVPPSTDKLDPCPEVASTSTMSGTDYSALASHGIQAISQGKVGCIILAGGQGTRLGSSKPKGEYNIGLPSSKSLFQLQIERILKLREVVKQATGLASLPSIPLYIMTSPMTDSETREFFRQHNNFDYPEADIKFFSQGTLPCVTLEGKIMLESKSAVAEAPDGNGGIYRALHTQGIVADMLERNVVGVHVWAIDNALVKPCDPLFVGLCTSNNAQVGSKVCEKLHAHEKVGVLALKAGKYTVVEYSEMGKDISETVNPQTGKLLYNEANLCMHYYSLDFLMNQCSPDNLPRTYHIAKKSIPYANPETGERLSKEELARRHPSSGHITGIKLEAFIFDVFPLVERMSILSISRKEEFAPVKNAPGTPEDSPDSARFAISALHASWLQEAGGQVAGEGIVEISPLVSYDGRDLDQAFTGVTFMAPLSVCTAKEFEKIFKDRAQSPLTPVSRRLGFTSLPCGTHVYCVTD